MTESKTAVTLDEIALRDVEEADLPKLFQIQKDRKATFMAAFTAKAPDDREAFLAQWERMLKDDTMTTKVILLHGRVVGQIGKFLRDGTAEVCYWIDRKHWGKGIATLALGEFIPLVEQRPLYGRAAKDNLGSRRVLEKCGFVIDSYGVYFSNSRGEEVDEVIMRLD